MESSRFSKPSLEEVIKQTATQLQFSNCRISKTNQLESYKKYYQEFLDQKHHGKMDFLEKHFKAKFDTEHILPNAKSLIIVTLNYFQARKNAKSWAPKIHIPSHKEGQIARYAFGRDYHKTFKAKLKLFAKKLNELNQDSSLRYFADSGPLLERQEAQQAGIGYIGKNTLLITREYGSWVMIGEIITTEDLKADQPFDRTKMVCGSCNKCQVSCPTGALYEDYKMDGSKCISYLTIEHKGKISEELMPKMGSWLFGCDICQEVCPHNFRAKDTHVPDFKNAIAGEKQNLSEILQIKDDIEYLEKFKGSPLMRAKRENLVRNAIIVATNLKRKDLIPLIKNLKKDPSPTIQYTADWSLKNLILLL